MTGTRYITAALWIACVIALLRPSGSRAESGAVTIDWAAVDGAIRYEVKIADKKGTTVLEKTVPENRISFRLPPGNYRMKVRAVNIFEKIGSESEWENFIIAKKGPGEAEKYYNYRFRGSLGLPYVTFMPEWNSLLKDSYSGVEMRVGFFGKSGLWRHIGGEAEASYSSFDGKEAPASSDYSLKTTIASMGLCYGTRFEFPLNFFIRFGVGAAKSALTYTPLLTATENSKNSTDLYYHTGISVEYNFYRNFYLEAGADYYEIQLSSEPVRGIKYSFHAGFRL
jgi:hypothetical protein